MNTKNKYTKLFLSLILDTIGYISFIIPGIAELTDVIWAPISAYIMINLYKGKSAKIAAVISFIEEAMPGLDIIPTFTLMWLYSYVFTDVKENKNYNIKKTIDL